MSLLLALILLVWCVAVHEAGHWIAARALGLRYEFYFRFPLSLGVRSEPSRIVGAAGPLISLLMAAGAFAFGSWVVCLCSLLLCVGSLPPVKPFDGYWIFR